MVIWNHQLTRNETNKTGHETGTTLENAFVRDAYSFFFKHILSTRIARLVIARAGKFSRAEYVAIARTVTRSIAQSIA